MKILQKDTKDIIKVAEEVFTQLAEIANKEGQNRRAGILTIRIPGEGYNRIVQPIGNVAACTEKELQRWSFNSQEKAERLEMNLKNGHVSSEQSRDFDNGKYRGAIYSGRNVIISFSGLSEYDDETLNLIIGYNIGWMSWSEIDLILEISKNTNADLIEKLAA